MENENDMKIEDYQKFYEFFIQTFQKGEYVIQEIANISKDYRNEEQKSIHNVKLFRKLINDDIGKKTKIKSQKQISISIMNIFSTLDLIYQI